jgi:nitrogen fixation NifU-like protein
MIPLDDMYREVILDHYRSPRGKKPLDESNVSTHGHNPSCGDDIKMSLMVKDQILKDIHIDCQGCAISTASGSILAETMKGRSFDEVIQIAERVKKLLKGELEDISDDDNLEDIESLKGVRQFPVRIKCALLAWVTLIEGLKNFADGKTDGEITITGEQGH